MFSRNEQFISQTKLRELRLQRDRSQAAYATLQQALANVQDDAEAVTVLYTHLHTMTFAHQPLHPAVQNLEPVLREIAGGAASPELLAFWRQELEQEVQRGHARADVVYTFGALLQEWVASAAREQGTVNMPPLDVETALFQQMTTITPAAGAQAFLTNLCTSLIVDPARLHTYLREQIPVLHKPASAGDVKTALDAIIVDPDWPSRLRQEAQDVGHNAILLKEWADALTIQLDHWNEWAWPQAGVAYHIMADSNGKWRTMLGENLADACFLEIIGGRWRDLLNRIIGRIDATDETNISFNAEGDVNYYLRQLVAEGDRFTFTNAVGVATIVYHDIWFDPTNGSEREENHFWGEYDAVLRTRMKRLESIQRLSVDNAYGSNEAGGMDIAVALVNAELQLKHTGLFAPPLYILKADLRDYYASLPHDVILTIMRAFGIPDDVQRFLGTYLQVPLQHEESMTPVQTGIFFGRMLADVLGEWLMRLLDHHVQTQAHVQVVRVVDDICFLATSAAEITHAWEALQEFCTACGLRLNDDKCGTICIGGEVPANLPQAQPTWQLITLDTSGQWSVDTAGFARYLDHARAALDLSAPLMALIPQYNSIITHLEHTLFLKVPLGERHRVSVQQALIQVRNGSFRDGYGAIADVQEQIHGRFTRDAAMMTLPEAWYYWPVTAGGLGLKQPLTIEAIYAEPFYQRKNVPIPAERQANWQTAHHDWSRFFTQWLTFITPAIPTSDAVMATLMKDFIARGSDLSQGKQTDLSPYWQWIVYLYGPQIRATFGTFRFLFSELVPLQLLTVRQLHGEIEQEAPGAHLTDFPF